MSNKFFTNKQPNSLLNKFNAIFENNPHIQIFHCVSGYFRASGYYNLKEKLQNLDEVKILVGIDVDKINDFYIKKNKLQFNIRQKLTNEYAKSVVEDIIQSDYTKENEQGIRDFFNAKNCEVRIHKSKKLHAKIYIFLPQNYNEHTSGNVITGSSNFTGPGLGATEHHNNYEFNVELRDYADVSYAESEFQSLWAEGEPVDWNIVQNAVKTTHIDSIAEPYYLYIKFLIEFFADRIDYDEDSIGDVPEHYKKLRYQIDAVNEAYKMLLDFDGCFLADVVGLGKTVVAAMTAKKLALENSKKKTRILVVYPPTLERNWKETFKEFKLDAITDFVSIGSLNTVLDDENTAINYQSEDYSIVIVDEAHRFRNAKTDRYSKLEAITKSPIKNCGNIITKKKILLLTATPFNNTPNDLLNMILLFTNKYNSSLPVRNLGNYFAPKIAEYTQIMSGEQTQEKLEPLMERIRNEVIQPITVRRTRSDLINNKMYADDLQNQHIQFPHIENPSIFEYTMNSELETLFTFTIENISEKLNYSRYQIISMLKDSVLQKFYPEINVEHISKNLSTLMKIRLVKSLESSFTAFKSTLQKLLNSTTEMLKMIENGKVYFAPNGTLMDWLDNNISYEEIEDEIQKKQSKGISGFNIFTVLDDFNNIKLETAKIKLQSDKAILQHLINDWASITDDPKFNTLVHVLPQLIQKSNKNPSGKIVIFSESKITCNYLAEKLQKIQNYNILNVSADNRKELFTIIRENFDANIHLEKQKDDYNILLSTEVLAEGVNLHRANVLLNYDIPWNSTKLMQRLGRVNRIGSVAKSIYNYAFYPSAQGDSHIDLKNKAYTKLQAFHYTYGEDSQILSSKEKLISVVLFNPNQAEYEDERLHFLQHIRDLKKNNPSLFEKIKKLPIKSRSIIKETPRSKAHNASSAVFLKNGEKLRFLVCQNQKEETAKSVDFITFARLLECEPHTKSENRITDTHYTDVQTALLEFNKKEIETNIQNTAKPTDIKLLKLIKEIRQKQNAENSTNILAIIDLLQNGTYNKLREEAQKCVKIEDTSDFNNTIKILAQKYVTKNQEKTENDSIVQEKPHIILSETFVTS